MEMKHIGSATKDDDIAALVESAEAWIAEELMDNDTIIARYHDLWHVEATLRMTKDDLE